MEHPLIQLLLVAIITFLITVGLGLLVARQIARRIDRVIEAAEQVAHGDLDIRIEDKHQDEIGQLARAFNQMVENLDFLRRSRDLVGRTMSPAVRQSLIEKGLDFRGIIQDVCILFIDIWDFTRITEGYNPEQLVFFLNDYYTTIASQVHLGGGIIGKYGGDSILAYFGAPNPEPISKSVTEALLTSLALQDAIEQLSDRWSILGLPRIRVGMGLSVGPVVAGPIGSEEQFEYTVIGDSVNLAARLQDLTRSIEGYGIILTTEVYEALADMVKDQIRVVCIDDYDTLGDREKARQPVQCIDLGLVSVKGKQGPVHVYGIPDVDNKRG
jgi:class 3 adenylate cyclase